MRTLLGLLLVCVANLSLASSEPVAKASCHKQQANGYTTVRPIRSNKDAKRCLSRGGEIVILEPEKLSLVSK